MKKRSIVIPSSIDNRSQTSNSITTAHALHKGKSDHLYNFNHHKAHTRKEMLKNKKHKNMNNLENENNLSKVIANHRIHSKLLPIANDNTTINTSDNQTSSQLSDTQLNNEAIKLILMETERAKERADKMGALGWTSNKIPKVNKKFLRNTIQQTISLNKRHSK